MGNETLRRFIELCRDADAISIDSGPVMTSWDLAPGRRALFSAMYVDEVGVGYEYALTEEEISGGEFTDGAFRCRDSGGEQVRICFYRLSSMM